MKGIGLTGGIGSGKTTVAKVFQHFGIPVYNSDENARRLMVSDNALIAQITSAFGSESYLENGQLNKDYLRTVVFGNTQSREQINALVNPAVGKDFKTWADGKKSPFVLFESALLYQSTSKELMDCIFTVSAPEQVRIERTVLRDGISKDAAMQRIQSQAPQTDVDKWADEVIINDGEQLVIPQVINLIKKYSNG